MRSKEPLPAALLISHFFRKNESSTPISTAFRYPQGYKVSTKERKLKPLPSNPAVRPYLPAFMALNNAREG